MLLGDVAFVNLWHFLIGQKIFVVYPLRFDQNRAQEKRKKERFIFKKYTCR